MKKLSSCLLVGFVILLFPSFVEGDVRAALDLTDGKVVFETSGDGDLITSDFEATEGSLEVHITHQTSLQYEYFGVDFESDANLNGKFCDETEYCNLLTQGGYEDIMNLDTTVTWSSFPGGKGRFVLDAPGTWTLVVTQHPSPLHTVSGIVEAGLLGNPSLVTFAENVVVTATSSEGEVFSAVTDFVGDYSLKVYGYTDYEIIAVLPQYSKAIQNISRQDFLDLGNPGWSIERSFELQEAPLDTGINSIGLKATSMVSPPFWYSYRYVLLGGTVLFFFLIWLIWNKRRGI